MISLRVMKVKKIDAWLGKESWWRNWMGDSWWNIKTKAMRIKIVLEVKSSPTFQWNYIIVWVVGTKALIFGIIFKYDLFLDVPPFEIIVFFSLIELGYIDDYIVAQCYWGKYNGSVFAPLSTCLISLIWAILC